MDKQTLALIFAAVFGTEIIPLMILGTMLTWEKMFPREDVPHDEYK